MLAGSTSDAQGFSDMNLERNKECLAARVLLLGLGVLFLGLLGCGARTEKAPQKTADNRLNAADKGACGAYSAKVCSNLGKDSALCIATLTATDVMPDAACAQALTNFSFTQSKLATIAQQCEAFVAKICAEFGPQSETCAGAKLKVTKVTRDECDRMVESYASIAAGLHEELKGSEPLEAGIRKRIEEGEAPSFGPKNAKVTLVEFSDFECPFCARSAPVTQALKAKYGDKIRFVFRQFPLAFHPNAQGAAEASLAAHQQGKFWEYHALLFANPGRLDRPALEQHAQALDLEMSKFRTAMSGGSLAPTVKADVDLGDAAGVKGTPTLFVNGRRAVDASNLEAVSALVEEALKQPS